MDLQGKVCMVTGGTHGIGRAVVERFAQAKGAAIIPCDIDDEPFDELRRIGKPIDPHQLDVTDVDNVTRTIQKIRSSYGRIDVLVNCAGTTRDAFVHKMSDDAWHHVMQINLTGTFHVVRSVAPFMIERGSGSIVNVAATIGLDGNIGQTNYAAANAGVVGMTKTLAKELARGTASVRANAVAPGFIKTRMVDSIPPKVADGIIARTPLGKMGEPADVAEAVLFLASDAAGFITGQVLRVDGGFTG